MDLFALLGWYEAGLPRRTAQHVDRTIALALRHMHVRRIAHLDVKPENVLVSFGGPRGLTVKLGDFGVSVSPDTKCSDFAGSPGFFAPEVLLEPTYDPFAADVWSFGVVAVETKVARQPFHDVWLKAYTPLETDNPSHVQTAEFRDWIERRSRRSGTRRATLTRATVARAQPARGQHACARCRVPRHNGHHRTQPVNLDR